MTGLLTKHSVVQTFKKQVLVSEEVSLTEKEACRLKLTNINLQVMKFRL